MDTKVLKTANNEAGVLGETLTVAEVTSVIVDPVPEEESGIIVFNPGTATEEAVLYRSKDDGAGTINNLTRDYNNQNSGVGREHDNGDPWETMQLANYIDNVVDALREGYVEELATCTKVDADTFTVVGDKTSIYTQGRIIRFNQTNTTVGRVTSSSYSSGTGLTTVETELVTIPTITNVEYSLQPKSGAGFKDVYYAEDAEADDDYTITLSPAPSSLAAGFMIVLKPNTANTGAATLQVNALSAVAIKKYKDGSKVDVETGDIIAAQPTLLEYDGTHFVLLSRNQLTKRDYYELTDGATITIDLSAVPNRKFKVTLGGNRILALSNASAGDMFLLKLIQDGTGSRTITAWFHIDSTFETTDVVAGTDIITTGRDIPTGTRMRFTSAGTLPAGISLATDYYAIRQSATTMKIATSLANARAGTNVDITDVGSGQHTVQVYPKFTSGGTAPTLSTGTHAADLFGVDIGEGNIPSVYTVGADEV